MQAPQTCKRKEYGGNSLPVHVFLSAALNSGKLQCTRTATMSLTKCAEWAALQAHHEEMKKVHMRELFTKDTERFDKFR